MTPPPRDLPHKVHEGGADVFRGDRQSSGVGGAGRGQAGGGGGLDEDGAAEQPGYFSEFLSARISRHPIFTDMRFWQHVLSEAVQAKTEKVIGSVSSCSRSRSRNV